MAQSTVLEVLERKILASANSPLSGLHRIANFRRDDQFMDDGFHLLGLAFEKWRQSPQTKVASTNEFDLRFGNPGCQAAQCDGPSAHRNGAASVHDIKIRFVPPLRELSCHETGLFRRTETFLSVYLSVRLFFLLSLIECSYSKFAPRYGSLFIWINSLRPEVAFL